MTVFVDGNPPECQCTSACPMPCWQRVGLTENPCCKQCAPLPLFGMEEAA